MRGLEVTDSFELKSEMRMYEYVCGAEREPERHLPKRFHV